MVDPAKGRKKSKKRRSAKRRPTAAQLEHAAKVYEALRKLYSTAHCELNFSNPFELLVATILSAQCTDVRVNLVTPQVFERYPDPEAMAQADPAELEALIRTTGFFRNKARSLRGASERIAREFGGRVPDEMDDLLSLPGVARKTANVVLGNAFGKNEGFVVDTHIARLSKRLGLTRQTDPDKIEQDLMVRFPREAWTDLSHMIIWHGRRVCDARKPDCDRCTLENICPKIGVTAGKSSKRGTARKKAAKKK